MLHESYKLSCQQVLEHFGSDAVDGLKSSQLSKLKEKYGLNGKKELFNDLIIINFSTKNCRKMMELPFGN